MPGATFTTDLSIGPGIVSFAIRNDGMSGREIADWYYAAMKKAKFDVRDQQFENGGFSYQGPGVQGDSASTTTSFIIGMSER